MKRFDDEDLIAYYLHELSPRKASALERALQTDSALAARYEAYTTMLRAFKAGAATMVFDEEVMARNWKALQPSLASSGVHPDRPFRWRFPALAGAGLALAATALFVAMRAHDAKSLPDTSSSRQPGTTTLLTPLSESAAAGNAQSGVPMMEEQGLARERRRRERPFVHLLTNTPQDLPGQTPQGPRLRMTAPLPLGTTDAAVPHFIPLASVPLPALPALLPNFVTVGPAGAPQTVATNARSKPGHARTAVHQEHPADLTFAMGGTLVGTREVNGTGTTVHTLGATHAVSALAIFHQQLRPAVGYRIAVSYARPDFQYGLRDATTNSGQTDINGRVYELAATYVVQGPHSGALSTSAEAGGGLMAFLPNQQSTQTSYNLRGAAVVGIAADYRLSKHLGIHAAYRAQIYKGPDFHDTGTNNSVVSTTFFSNEPMVGITYHFHSK